MMRKDRFAYVEAIQELSEAQTVFTATPGCTVVYKTPLPHRHV
jgi:hypothetical protein